MLYFEDLQVADWTATFTSTGIRDAVKATAN
jgi:hypothetical protein